MLTPSLVWDASLVTHHIQLDPKQNPVVHPPRKVPVTIRPKVKDELERMERLGVIERIQDPTDWVNSMVTVIKPNGKLRICIDPRDLNKRLPFGISSAPDVFQAIMSEMFGDIEDVEVVVDDLLIWGTTEEQHDSRLENVLGSVTSS